MNHKFLMLTGAVALVVVLLSLGDTLGGTPKAFADPASANWDVILCDGTFAGNATNDPNCTDALASVGDGDGIVETGENPEVQHVFLSDIDGGPPDEPFIGLGNVVWEGITPAPGSAITDGDIVGEGSYSLESNLTMSITSNVMAATGQPPVCKTFAPLGATYDFYDAELDPSQIVSHLDTDGDGLTQDFEDNLLADCVTPGQNNLMDGVDCSVEALETNLIPSIGLGRPMARAFAMAIVSVSLSVETAVTNLMYELPPDPENADYIVIALVAYPGGTVSAPSGPNLTNQTVITCPPFMTSVRSFGVGKGNPDALPAPITAGTVLRTAGADGTYVFLQDTTTTGNYDGDSAAGPWESCPASVSVDSDLVSAGNPDPDSDRWDSGTSTCGPGGDQPCCDPYPGSADNDADGSIGPYNLPVIGTWIMKAGNCNQAYVPPLTGGWECDQDVDGDGYLNTVDNCPTTPDADVDDADGDGFWYTGVDWQEDTDGDTVGDVCDPDPDVRGDGTGYSVDVHPHGMPGHPLGYHDHDTRCNDEITIPGTELADPSPNGFCAGVGPDGVHGNADDTSPYIDSGLDGTADWYDTIPGPAGTATPVRDGIYQIGETVEVEVDADADGHTDGCEALSGTDPLDTSSAPGPPATPGITATPTGTPGPAMLAGADCDGDGISDADEEEAGTNPFPPQPIGGIADIPPLADSAADESLGLADGSGWSAGGYATLAGLGALAAAAIATGGWYARRRWLR